MARLDGLIDQRGGPSACWPWTGGSLVRGYPTVGVKLATGGRRNVKVHRLVCEVANGEVDETVDHTCHDARTCPGGESCPHRRCLNPAHLIAESRARNASRNRAGLRRELCGRGHDLADAYIDPSGERHCRRCTAITSQERRARRPKPGHSGEYRPRGMTREELVDWGLDGQVGAGCWYWRGRTVGHKDGYLTTRDAGSDRMITVHRLVYEVRVGPVPDGRVVDHTCHGPECMADPCPHRACCRPDHLAAVLPGQNCAPHRRRRRPDVCKYGHALADAYVDKRGARHCRTCANDRQRASRTPVEVDGRTRRDGRCVNGHRIVDVGLDALGRCRGCNRDRNRRYKERQRVGDTVGCGR